MVREPTGNELTRISARNTRPQSSQLAEPLWTNPGVKGELCVRANLRFFSSSFKVQAGNESPNLPQNPRSEVNGITKARKSGDTSREGK